MERSQPVRANAILSKLISQTGSDRKQDILIHLSFTKDCNKWFFGYSKCKYCSWEYECSNNKNLITDLNYITDNIDELLFIRKAKGEQNGASLQ